MDKIKVSDIREKFPMYGDLSDDQLLISIRKKYYPDIPASRFYNNIDYDTAREKAQKELTDSMSTTDKLLAGSGKAFSDIGSSVQKLGAYVADFVSPRETKLSDLVTGNKPKSRVQELQEQIDEQQRLDKPLMDTTAGKVGKYGTDVALTFVPGLKGQQALTQGINTASRVLPKTAAATARVVAPYAGAAGSGAVLGALTSPEDMAGGAEGGAYAGIGGEAAGRVLSGAWNAGKAILDPLTEQGRNRVLKRTIERFATDPAKVRELSSAPSDITVPGRLPELAPGTLAEATGDTGIAQLQRASASAYPQVANALDAARKEQIAGYRSILDELAGNDGKREFFDAARQTAADQLYGKAYAEGLQNTPELQAMIQELMQRPSIRSAMPKARNLAAEKGMNIKNPQGSVAGMHYLKKALDDAISEASRAGRGAEVDALMGTRDKLLGYLGEASPAYSEAMTTYREMSRPINQMDIGQTLRNKALPALTDFNPDLSRVNSSSYAAALRDADRTARTATGMQGAKMGNIFDPDQMAAVNKIGEDMGRYAAAQEAGKVPGSPTAQYLGGQNVLRQLLGPLGLPQGVADAAAGRIISGIANLPYKLTANQTEDLLARALTEPGVAAKILATKDPKTIAEILRPYAAQAAIQGQIQ